MTSNRNFNTIDLKVFRHIVTMTEEKSKFSRCWVRQLNTWAKLNDCKTEQVFV
ncbi:hypothetical protein HMPREF0541_00884 [Lacticaseibacillus rhamnosus ATCC 21052]|nr:hypothetical protein HMPREF0541_00884 [Lacticaseibacillus rhamnosus ATCC 21052]